MPDEPEALGLLALMLLTESRRPARTDAAGRLVPLSEQDRSRWSGALISEGHQLVRTCLRRNAPGPYQLQAAISAVHSDAVDTTSTRWVDVVALYDQLQCFDPGPVVTLNRAVAVGEVHGPAAALALVDALAGELGEYHVFHAIRGDLLGRLGRRAEAAAAFTVAAGHTSNETERDHLRRRAFDATRQ